MRLKEVSSQVQLAKDKELADFTNHLMCKATQLKAHLNGTEGEDGYQLGMTRQEEKTARETIGNKDAQLMLVMAEVNIRVQEYRNQAFLPRPQEAVYHIAYRLAQSVLKIRSIQQR